MAPVGRPRAWMSWSSGKDSALALQATRALGEVEVTALLTTVNAEADRVTMHAVRRSLLEAQGRALGLRLEVIELPAPHTNEVYERAMAHAMARATTEGVRHVIFGDLFLEDVRAYREERLTGTGITPLFPLWGRPSAQVAGEIMASGIKAVLTCVDPARLPASFAGRTYGPELLAELPEGVDPCGENGEFHTFVTDGPGFAHPLHVAVGEKVERTGFVFADVLPAGDSAGALSVRGPSVGIGRPDR